MRETCVRNHTNTFIIHGHPYEVTALARFDCRTHQLLDDNELDDAAVEIANQKYRDEFGLITPQEIRSYRDKLNLSQHDFAELLGVNPDTIVLYEVGAFPSKTDNRMIKALFAEDER